MLPVKSLSNVVSKDFGGTVSSKSWNCNLGSQRTCDQYARLISIILEPLNQLWEASFSCVDYVVCINLHLLFNFPVFDVIKHATLSPTSIENKDTDVQVADLVSDSLLVFGDSLQF